MSNSQYHDRAQQRYGFTRGETGITYAVLKWFNGHAFDGIGSIGSTHEPTLRQLLQTHVEWSEELETAQDRMQQRGLLTDGYIAGRRCDWLPTPQFFTVAEEIFHDYGHLHPEWLEQHHTGPPCFRDGPEMMTHRKGVLAVNHQFNRTQVPQITLVDVYPALGKAENPDLRAWKHGEPAGFVEVLTDHNNRETWTRKYRAWSKEPEAKIWVFENRQTMTEFWNHLIRNNVIEISNGMIRSNPSNWSAEKINNRLQRSRTGNWDYHTVDVCWTLPSLVTADAVDVVDSITNYGVV